MLAQYALFWKMMPFYNAEHVVIMVIPVFILLPYPEHTCLYALSP